LTSRLCRDPRETSEHHDRNEKAHAEHLWWDWHAPYLNSHQNGSRPKEAAVAGRYMDESFMFFPDDAARVAALSSKR
jgi:hypothetical protein